MGTRLTVSIVAQKMNKSGSVRIVMGREKPYLGEHATMQSTESAQRNRIYFIGGVSGIIEFEAIDFPTIARTCI
jgi:hypothetical protein